MHYPWGHNRRFNAYANYLKHVFGHRIQKVTIDAGFSCPNRDGTKGHGGCAFCINDAFNPSYCTAAKSVRQQIEEGILFHKKRYRSAKGYLAYFQAYSNTHKPLTELRQIYDEVARMEDIAGIVIGTRPDCVDESKLDYFARLAEQCYLVIEYGIESVYNATLERINRCHTFEEAVEAIALTTARGIPTGGHIIFGLPGENRELMLDAASILSELKLHTIKMHQLQILKNTPLEKEWKESPDQFSLFESPEGYISFLTSFIERLNPAIMVERIAAESPPRYNAGPEWGLRYDNILRKFEQTLEENDSWQGKLYKT